MHNSKHVSQKSAGLGCNSTDDRAAVAGLFHAVIEQSGTDTNFWSYNRPVSQPWTYPQQTAERVGCPTEPPVDMHDCLKAIEDPFEIKNNSGVACTVR